ncbi:MAG: elongation factor G [Planctomycetota bacterium]|nr:elongation factor G [Planctomycetota bacterium]
MSHHVSDLRNIALFGHGSSGKTSIIDALAYTTKTSSRHGDSADETSISDTEPEEKEKKHTLTSHLFEFPIDDVRLNIIDTPGHADFVADTISSLSVVETGILCVSATGGVSFHARSLWKAAERANLGRAIVVTHPDGENANFENTLSELQEVFGNVVVPMTYPDGDGAAFKGVHDVLAGDGPNASIYREQLEERVAEADDDLLESYLENGEISSEDLEKNFPLAIVKGTLVPLFTVCAPKEKGLNKLLALIKKDLPSPVTFGPRGAAKPDSDSFGELVSPDESGNFLAQAFKVVVDKHVGKIVYMRAFRGTLKAGQGLYNVRRDQTDKIGGLLGLSGEKTETVSQVVAGDIFAVTRVDELHLWDTASSDSEPLKMAPPEFPMSSCSLAVMPAARGDEQKISDALERLSSEDPTFLNARHPETAELLVSGLSPLHLDLQLARLLRRFGVGTTTATPKIPYRETITGSAEGHHRHKKQSGGRGQFAEVYMRVAARQRGEGFEFVDAVVGGSIPRNFIPEVEKGVRKFMQSGGIAGFPVVDCKAELYDGKFHPVDSDQLSFQLAGQRGFLDGFGKAKPVLLEPIMDVVIQVPDRFTGDVAGNLSSQRGRMSGMEIKDGIQHISAQVPLKEMQDYSTQLRSITAGEGTFHMSQSHYEVVPGNLQSEIVKAYKKSQEDS